MFFTIRKLLFICNHFLYKIFDYILVSLIAVGLLWGCTNPFIKLGSQGIEKIDTGSAAKNVWLELKTLALRLKYWIPFLLNQSGSVLYVWTLQSCNITAAVPVANSLTFAFTAITGYMLGEKIPGKSMLYNMNFYFHKYNLYEFFHSRCYYRYFIGVLGFFVNVI